MTKLPGGLWPVMLTPFQNNGKIDFDALEELVNFYMENGAKGLFANCLSSEMYQLSFQEQINLVSKILRYVRNHIPVVASCIFNGAGSESDQIKKMADTGVGAVVLITGLLAKTDEPDIEFMSHLGKIMQDTGDIPLGLYECPVPYKRLIQSENLGELAGSGRFLYFKDTSCDMHTIHTRLRQIAGTNLSLFNANTPTAMDSVLSGASGSSPISANFYPELYSRLFKLLSMDSTHSEALELQNRLSVMDGVTRINYPLSAKYFLGMRGLKIKQNTRIPVTKLNFEEQKMLKSLYAYFMELK